MDFQDIDNIIFFLINHGFSNTFFDKAMPLLTDKGFLLFFPYVFYMLWKGYKCKNETDGLHLSFKTTLLTSLIAIFSFLLSDWFSHEMKEVFCRVRPCNALEGVTLLVGCSKSYSMPSNHAANSFAVAASLFFFTRRQIPYPLNLYPFLIAGLIAFSRVYIGVHYPSDITTGALFGTVISALLISFHKYSAQRYASRPYTTLLYTALFAISVFRVYYIFHGPLDLSPDEAHYWEWSRRPDLSYYSKGPAIAYLIMLGTSLFGDNAFGIRILAVIFSALSSVYIFKLVDLMYADEEQSRQQIALFSAVLFQVIPLFAAFGVIFTIDSPFMFFWILSLYLFWKAINGSDKLQVTSNESRPLLARGGSRGGHSSLVTRYPLLNWLMLGVSIGFGLLTKYTMVFFYPSAFLFLFFSNKKILLKTVKPYLAALISLVIFSPVIIWNIRHDFVAVRHTAGQAHVAGGFQISLISFIEFLGSQAGIITPLFFVLMFYSIFKLRSFDDKLKSDFLVCFSVPIIVFFLLKSIQGKAQANWAMAGYITGIIAMSRYYFTQRSSALIRNMFVGGALLALLVTAVSHYPSVINLPPKLNPSSRLQGWKELGMEISRTCKTSGIEKQDKKNVLIFSDSYQVASEMAFYAAGHPKTYCINLGRRMNQYDLWPDINHAAEKIKQSGNNNIDGIFVKIGDSNMPVEVARAFDRFEKKILKVHEKNYLLREYSIFTCYNFKGLDTKNPETF